LGPARVSFYAPGSPLSQKYRGICVPTFRAEVLQGFTKSLFVAAGVPDAEAEIVARSLVDGNLCGHDSHGVIRVLQYMDALRSKRFVGGVPLTKLRETPAIYAADANWGLGQVQSYRLLDILVPKAKALGIAAGTMRQCGHIGRLGEYAEWAAKRNLAFMATVNSHGSGQRVAPPGGIEGRLSTNPLCLGAPTTGDPLVLDIGTSAAAEGKIRVALQKGEHVPEGILQDHLGQPTTDPAALYGEPRGTMLPFGGPQAYKGFGLSLLLDALAGGLSGGKCSRGDAPLVGAGNSVVFVLFDVEQLGGSEHFLNETGTLAAYVRNTPTVAGVKAITLPGDPERLSKQKRLVDGIPISDGTWGQIVKVANELNVPVPKENE
jgi:hydroxycarboxylate dehydrogenase B